jgi:hypothetical protein
MLSAARYRSHVKAIRMRGPGPRSEPSHGLQLGRLVAPKPGEKAHWIAPSRGKPHHNRRSELAFPYPVRFRFQQVHGAAPELVGGEPAALLGPSLWGPGACSLLGAFLASELGAQRLRRFWQHVRIVVLAVFPHPRDHRGKIMEAGSNLSVALDRGPRVYAGDVAEYPYDVGRLMGLICCKEFVAALLSETEYEIASSLRGRVKPSQREADTHRDHPNQFQH